MRTAPRLFLSLVLLLVSQSAFAQVEHFRGFGFKGGFTRASIVTNLDPEISNYGLGKNKRLFNGAIFAEWFDTGSFSIVTQAEYAQRGFREAYLYRNANDFDRVTEAKSRFDYLSFPVLGKIRHSIERASAYAVLGPRLDLLLDRHPGVLESDEGRFPSILATNYNAWALGAMLGLGMEIRGMLPVPFFLEVRYNLELTDALSGSEIELVPGNTLRASSRATDLSFGIMF